MPSKMFGLANLLYLHLVADKQALQHDFSKADEDLFNIFFESTNEHFVTVGRHCIDTIYVPILYSDISFSSCHL